MTFKHSLNAGPGDKWGCAASLPVAFASPERGEGREQHPVASPGPGCRGNLCAPGPGTGTVPLSSPRGLCQCLEGKAGMLEVFKRPLHLQLSLPPCPSGSLLTGLGPRQLSIWGSCSLLQSSLSFRGWNPTNLAQHAPLAGPRPESISFCTSSGGNFASAAAPSLQPCVS